MVDQQEEAVVVVFSLLLSEKTHKNRTTMGESHGDGGNVGCTVTVLCTLAPILQVTIATGK